MKIIVYLRVQNHKLNKNLSKFFPFYSNVHRVKVIILYLEIHNVKRNSVTVDEEN
jgi:hypothetical protein